MMKLTNQAHELLEVWKSKQYSFEQALQSLEHTPLSNEEQEALKQAWKKHLSDQRQKPGFVYMGIGSVLGFLSCVLTMMDLVPGMNGFFLYGLTSVAIAVVLYGCYLVFE